MHDVGKFVFGWGEFGRRLRCGLYHDELRLSSFGSVRLFLPVHCDPFEAIEMQICR